MISGLGFIDKARKYMNYKSHVGTYVSFFLFFSLK